MDAEYDANSNENPGSLVNVYTAETFPAPVNLDYITSGNAAEIDKGIRETIRGIRVSILSMGIALARVKENDLYKDLGHKSFTMYIRQLGEETKVDTSNIFLWLRVGEAYIKHQSDLKQIDFSDSDGPTKLSYLKRALENNGKKEVFDNIKTMSVREFKNFAKGQTGIESPCGRRWLVNIRGNSIYINNKLAVITSKKIDPRVSAYFKKVHEIACEALEKEGMFVPVFIRSRKDAGRFEDAVHRLKAEMGLK